MGLSLPIDALPLIEALTLGAGIETFNACIRLPRSTENASFPLHRSFSLFTFTLRMDPTALDNKVASILSMTKMFLTVKKHRDFPNFLKVSASKKDAQDGL